MRKSLNLRLEPTLRQTEAILSRIEGELSARGARVEREGFGGLRFRMPAPWRTPRLGILLAVTRGRVMVSAGAGGPWRVRYELSFIALRVLAGLASIATIIAGLDWNRISLINALVLLWLLLYGLPYYAASARFHRLVHHSARDILERRRTPRPTPTAAAPPWPAPASGGGTAPSPEVPNQAPPPGASKTPPQDSGPSPATGPT